MKRILILTILLMSSLAWAGSTTVVVGQGGGGAAFCSAAGNIVEETWDTESGEDNTWADTTSGTNTLDPDHTPQAVTGFDTQCLNTAARAAWGYAYQGFNAGSESAITYIRFYLYVNSEGLDDGEYFDILRAINSTGSTVICRMRVMQESGQLKLHVGWVMAAGQPSGTMDISTGTSYLVEIKTDDTNDALEWKVNSVSQGSFSVDPTDGIQIYRVGVCNSVNATIDIEIDNFGVSSSGWLGSCGS
ncbi:MAG TPA: hypothetical protein PLT30_12925 [Deltaproteobacteria bacterium]|nr:hypothetical protein [Deltaproteobacteria bacterium]